MTSHLVEVPEGFTPVAIEPEGSWQDRYTVLFVPFPGQTVFEMGVARHNDSAHPDYRWKDVDGDNIGECGREVFAWRLEAAIPIVRTGSVEPETVEPTDRRQYEHTIGLLSDHHMELLRDFPEEDTTPGGIGLCSRMFRVPAAQVQRDYLALTEKRMREETAQA